MKRLMRMGLMLVSVLVCLSGPAIRAQLVACQKSSTAPVAIADDLEWPGGPIVIDVLGNDYDADGDILSIASFSGAAHGTVSYTEDGEAILYTPTDATAMGDTFSYTVTDGGFSTVGQVHLTVDPIIPPPPPPPAARVWFDYHCDNLTCFFTAHWENIEDTPRFTSWTWGDGQSLNNYQSLTALHDYTPGTRNALLTITFVSGRTVTSAPAQVVVNTPTVTCAFLLPPVPAGSVNPTSSLQFNTRVTFLSNFQQADFPAYDYFWDFADGRGLIQVSSASVFSLQGLTYQTPGTRLINFIIRPRNDPTVVGQCPRNIDFVNAAPVPDFTTTPGDGVTETPKYIHFQASASDEFPDLTWEFNYGDGTFQPPDLGYPPRHLYARPGNYTVVAKVTDRFGASGTVQKIVTVQDDPPVIHWGFNCAGRTCKFDATYTYDDSDNVTYRWNFGDGTPLVSTSAKTVDHTFPADSPYDATLTVDDGTNQVSAAKRVTPRGAPQTPPLAFYTVPPCRAIDTQRDGILQGNTAMDFLVAGRCGVPDDAKAVAVNVTVNTPSDSGALFLYPAGAARTPPPSVLNFTPQRSPRTNGFIVPLGTSGAITALALMTGSTHFTLDVTGYLSDRLTSTLPAKGPLRAAFWWPYRYFDTIAQPPAMTAGATRNVAMRRSNFLGVPLDAVAVWVNVAALNPTAAGSLNVFASDLTSQPATSFLNVQAGVAQQNGAFTALGRRTNDDLSVVYNAPAGSTTNFSVESSTWFSPDAKYRYVPIEPCRAIDTRETVAGGPRIARDGYRTFQLQGNCGVPYGPTSIMVVARIINADTAGTAMVGGAYFPETTNISFAPGDTIAATTIVGSGTIPLQGCCQDDISVKLNGASADLVLDVIGYFVVEENAPPATNPDFVNAVINVAKTVDVVANDRDANADLVKLSTRGIFNPPVNGTATRASDTSITYTGTVEGTDTVEYEVIDARGALAHGTLTVNVRATNDSPIAVDDTAAVTPGTALPVNVLANDSDPNRSAIRLSDVAIVIAPSIGSAIRQSDTTILYTAPAGGSGTDTLTYEIVNAAGVTSRGRLTITMNRAPTARADAAVVQAGVSTAIDVLANDTDPDGNLPRLDSPAIVTAPTAGTASVHADGRRIVYTPSGTGNDTFTYAIVDGAGGRSVGTVTTSVNRPPVAVNDAFSIIGAVATDLNVTANDSDPNAGDSVRLAASPFRSLPAKGTAVRKSDSTITYTPASGATGADNFTIEVNDTHGGSATSTVTVSLCTASAAIVTSPVSVSANRGQTVTLSVAATGGGLTYQWYEGPSPSITNPVGTNSATFQTTVTATKTYWVRVSNACSFANSAAATITLVNAPPIPKITFNCQGLRCDLSGLNSQDDAGINTWTWTFSDMPSTNFTGSTLTHTFPWGCYTATLATRDTDNATATTQQTIAAGDYTPQLPWKLVGVSSDTHALSYRPAGQPADVNTNGNLNGVLEPGERVVIEPTVKLTNSSTFNATATALTSSSPSVTGTLLVPAASYTAPAGFTNCWATGKCFVVQALANGARSTPHVDLTLTQSSGTTGVSGPVVIHVGNSFADVPPTAWYYGIVESVTHAELTSGCGSGNFCPSGTLTRGAIPVWLLRAKYGPAYNPPACTAPGPFNDVSCGYYSAPWIQQIKAEGITSGTGGGNYSPEATLSRAEMAPFILRTLYGASYQPPACSGAGPYSDVPCSYWASTWIADLKNRGFATDCAAGQYCPDTAVNRVDAAYLMYRSFGLAIDRRICSTTVYTSALTEGEANQ